MTSDLAQGAWFYSCDHGELGQVIEAQTIWGQTICRVWLPSRDVVVRISASRLVPLESAGTASPDHIQYTAAAARVADALTQDVLLAPIGSSIIPLPHQILALSRAVSGDRVRYLLADEVGLGKTIEAGLIMRELKLRGLVKRTLVVAPKGLVDQWVAEMRLHFGEDFKVVLPEDLEALRRVFSVSGSDLGAPGYRNLGPVPRGPELGAPNLRRLADSAHQPAGNRELTTSSVRFSKPNVWQMFSQVVVPMDAVKPIDRRRGWTAAQVEQYNRERFEDLIWAGWDLVIIDEAHRLAGSTDQVARFRLGRGLSEAAPYLLLLSATPHQGKTDAFHRLVSLIDPRAFPDAESVTRERIQPYVIRTEKRRAIDTEGRPLFKPRYTQLVPISWGERHQDQRLLYQAVSEYVRDGYNEAIRERRTYIGFLMILMQRLVVSSTRAIRTALERRLQALNNPQEHLSLLPLNFEEEWGELDGQQQLEALLPVRFTALRNERAEVKRLLEIAARCEEATPDAKAEALLDWIYRLQAEEGDPNFKLLVFTEFIPTQEMLHQFLSERGFTVVCLNGSMDLEERRRVQEAFAHEARILISTDAGGEGLNLQFCHVVINYDIPWNPMRLEQRIGRVDRIGQKHAVRAINFVLEESVEHRVREVLEEKLAVILEELRVDKTGDVLDSAQAGRVFEDLYLEAILNPDKVEDSVNTAIAEIERQIRGLQANASILGPAPVLDPGEAHKLLTHPLPYWVERMTVNYLNAHGGKAERHGHHWDLTWPDGKVYVDVVFSAKEAEQFPTARHLTLEDPRVRGLAMRLPRFVPGQPVPVVSLPGVAREIQGFWSLWQISAVGDSGPETRYTRVVPLFLSDSNKVFIPTARHIWDQLLVATPLLHSTLDAESSATAFAKLEKAAEEFGRPVYEALVQEHKAHIAREREKAAYAFASRRKAIERIGLPQVRGHRLNLLARQERSTWEELERRAQVSPEMTCLLLIRVEGGGGE
ncbi:MAG: helicase-related protein [Bacillota bacterium]